MPTATHSGTITYSLTPALPMGLTPEGAISEVSTPPTIGGTPSATAPTTTYTYTASETADSTSTASLTFDIIVRNPMITITPPDGSTLTFPPVHFFVGATETVTLNGSDLRGIVRVELLGGTYFGLARTGDRETTRVMTFLIPDDSTLSESFEVRYLAMTTATNGVVTGTLAVSSQSASLDFIAKRLDLSGSTLDPTPTPPTPPGGEGNTSLGVGDLVLSGLDLYSVLPNPFEDVLTVSGGGSSSLRVGVYSVSGSLILDILFEGSDPHTFDTSSLSSGVYILMMEGGSGVRRAWRVVRR